MKRFVFFCLFSLGFVFSNLFCAENIINVQLPQRNNRMLPAMTVRQRIVLLSTIGGTYIIANQLQSGGFENNIKLALLFLALAIGIDSFDLTDREYYDATAEQHYDASYANTLKCLLYISSIASLGFAGYYLVNE